jgi:hypothetical protein
MPLHSPETSSITMMVTSVTQHHNIGVNIKQQMKKIIRHDFIGFMFQFSSDHSMIHMD